jgi:hypothetical protein
MSTCSAEAISSTMRPTGPHTVQNIKSILRVVWRHRDRWCSANTEPKELCNSTDRPASAAATGAMLAVCHWQLTSLHRICQLDYDSAENPARLVKAYIAPSMAMLILVFFSAQIAGIFNDERKAECTAFALPYGCVCRHIPLCTGIHPPSDSIRTAEFLMTYLHCQIFRCCLLSASNNIQWFTIGPEVIQARHWGNAGEARSSHVFQKHLHR